MPINSNGSSLKVITNIQGKLIDNEDLEYRRTVYHGNKTTDVSVDELEQTPKPTPKKKSLRINTADDEALLKAIKKDLNQRNIK